MKDMIQINDHKIRTDENGFICLTDIWKASGNELYATRPTNWKQYAGKLFIDQVSQKVGIPTIWVTIMGKNGGTFAHWQIALAYAKWVSDDLHMQVNEIFMRYKSADPNLAVEIAENTTDAGLNHISKSIENLSRMDILKMAIDSEEGRVLLENKVKEDQPKVEFHDRVTESKGGLTMNQAAKHLGTGQNRLFNALRKTRILTKENIPYQNQIDLGRFYIVLKTWEDQYGADHVTKKTLVTPSGLTWLDKTTVPWRAYI